MSTSEPVVVFYKYTQCKFCRMLTEIWDQVKEEMLKVRPGLRFFIITSKTKTGDINPDVYPKDIKRYNKWFPMVLLIPGKLWNSAMENLGSNNPILLLDGVQVFNGIMRNGFPQHVRKYDSTKPEHFANWLRSGLNAIEQRQTVPPVKSSQQSTIIKPMEHLNENQESGYIASRSALEPGGSICSIRLMTRPK